MNVNYDRVCRLCLSSRGEILPIFPTTSSDDSEPPVLASKIKECVSVQINENDDLPTNVCRKCMDNVNNWHIFKTVCERTQNKLHSLIKKDGSQLEEVKVKSEPLSDEAYHDGVVIDGSYPDPEPGPSKLQPEGPPILASLGLTPRSDKKYVDPRMDWDRVHAILDMIQDDEPIDSLQSTEESDTLQNSDHESDSEAELLPLIDNYYTDCTEGYLCKNDKVLSNTPLPSVPTRGKETGLKKRRIINERQSTTPTMAWKMLFTDDLLEIVVSATNENILNNGSTMSQSTNVRELRTFIGILYLQGIMRPTHPKCIDLWDKYYGIPCIGKAMNYSRFKFLMKNISFFDQENDISMMQLDQMARMRKVFEIFALNCRTAFDVSDNVVIDEILVPVYGPCPFRYDMKNKPLKRGIKMVLLVDPNNFYVSNLDVITDPFFEAVEVVKKLVQHLAGSGKTVVMDSWFTSVSLMNKLKSELSLFTIGALNPKDEMIPPLFLYKNRKCCSNLNAFVNEDITMTSNVNSKSKCVTVLTNVPKFYRKSQSNSYSSVTVYKKSHSAVEVVDVLMHYYTTMQYVNNWTLSLFFTMLNVASVNAQVIWSSQENSNIMPRRSFIRDLALSLLEYGQSMDSEMFELDPGTTRRDEILQLGGELMFKGRRRCSFCSKTEKCDRRTKLPCLKCKRPVCKEHSVSICTMCI